MSRIGDQQVIERLLFDSGEKLISLTRPNNVANCRVNDRSPNRSSRKRESKLDTSGVRWYRKVDEDGTNERRGQEGRKRKKRSDVVKRKAGKTLNTSGRLAIVH